MIENTEFILEKLEAQLNHFGLVECPYNHERRRTNAIDVNFMISRYIKDKIDLLISKGCLRYSNPNTKYRDEYVISYNTNRAELLLDMVSYYHLTRRTFDFSEIISIGNDNLEVKYLYVSVPFFLPGYVNEIKIQKRILHLKWLMPINQFEKEYIELWGSEAFEKKLSASQYGFFSIRDNMKYLTD